MNNARYYPTTLSGKLAWMVNFSTRLTAAPATYGLTAGDATAVAAVVNPLPAAFSLASNPGTATTVTRAARDTALRAAELFVLPLAVTVSRNEDVAPNDKVNLKVNVPSTTRSIVPAPTARPVLAVRTVSGLVAKLEYQNSETPGKSGAPLGCTVELYYVIGTTAAVDPAQLTYRGKRTRSPFTIETSAGDAGKVVSVSMKFTKRNGTNGQNADGPWADIVTFIAGSAGALG